MSAFNTGIKNFTVDKLKNILGKIRKNIPVGMKHRDVACLYHELPPMESLQMCKPQIIPREYEAARKQLGTLGGGNHFIELQKDEEGNLWVMIHSGSRNLGKQVADHYNKIAVALNEKYFSQVPKEWQLAFLPEDSDEAQNYLAEMRFCLEFAFCNRKKMMGDIINIMSSIHFGEGQEIINSEIINIHHNFASKENNFGHNVWVHRKGATQAYEGMIGIIPGN